MTRSEDAPTTRTSLVGPGRVLAGRYELGATLGSGGMAVVLEAQDRVLERTVAVKILRAQYGTDPVFLARFTREALNAARLSHPGLVTIFDAGVDDGTAYIVMELVHGRTVHEILRTTGPLPVGDAVAIAIDVCDVLDVAHRAGVVHRDIKPGNILISDDGRTRVFDFGIARTDGSDALTQVATVIGTAAYVSPEQAGGDPAGPRSDLYALGCALTEMLTGTPPYSAATPVALLYQQIHEPAPLPSSLRPEVSAELDAVVLHLLAKDPDDRPPTAMDARRELLALPIASRVDTLVLPAPAGASTSVLPAASAARTSVLPAPAVATAEAGPDGPGFARRNIVVIAILVAAVVLGLVVGGLIRDRSAGSAGSAGSPTPTPSGPAVSASRSSLPSATPTVSATQEPVPPLTVATATTVEGALESLRSVIGQGEAAGLIDPSAASSLFSLTDAVEKAAAKGRGKSAPAKIEELSAAVLQYADSGQISSDALPALLESITQLSGLIG